MEEQPDEAQQFVALLKGVVGAVSATAPVTDRDNLARLSQSLRTVAARFKSGNPSRIAKNTDTEWQDIKLFFWGVGNLEVFTKHYDTDSLPLKKILEMVLNPITKFEEQYCDLAKYLHDKFARQNWGVTEDDEKESTSKSKEKKRSAEEDHEDKPTAKKQKSAPLDKSKIKRASKNHPIYGENGIMRGILWYPTKKGSQTCLDDKYPVKDARVYGHNGLDIGAWFPRQLAALRDGAHGERMAGIAGDPDTGAWSVVVSNAGYGGIDKDEGDVITYSAPGAFDTKAKKADTEGRGAKCLLASFATKKPVRVLRGQTPWKSAPFSGYRYDGLYTVEEKGEGTNKAGGVYIWVKLVRVSNQEPIQKKVPKKQQRDQEEKVSDGY